MCVRNGQRIDLRVRWMQRVCVCGSDDMGRWKGRRGRDGHCRRSAQQEAGAPWARYLGITPDADQDNGGPRRTLSDLVLDKFSVTVTKAVATNNEQEVVW